MEARLHGFQRYLFGGSSLRRTPSKVAFQPFPPGGGGGATPDFKFPPDWVGGRAGAHRCVPALPTCPPRRGGSSVVGVAPRASGFAQREVFQSGRRRHLEPERGPEPAVG